MSTLYAGKFLGEFGHELFAWQGYLRALSRNYDRTFVECRKGHEALYEDFATIGTPEGMSEGAAMRDVDIVRTPEDVDRSTWPIVYRPGREPSEAFKAQEFVQYGCGVNRYRVTFHARRRDHRSGDNWGINKWGDLAKQRPSARWIGSRSESIGSGNCLDRRGDTLRETARLLSESGVLAGTSSGPMHFGALCGVPLVVWGGGAKNRQRYETDWNPFDVPVRFIDSWHPSVGEVNDAIQEVLDAQA